MTIFHLRIDRASPMRHDETDAKGFIVSIEIFALVIELWVGV